MSSDLLMMDIRFLCSKLLYTAKCACRYLLLPSLIGVSQRLPAGVTVLIVFPSVRHGLKTLLLLPETTVKVSGHVLPVALEQSVPSGKFCKHQKACKATHTGRDLLISSAGTNLSGSLLA